MAPELTSSTEPEPTTPRPHIVLMLTGERSVRAHGPYPDRDHAARAAGAQLAFGRSDIVAIRTLALTSPHPSAPTTIRSQIPDGITTLTRHVIDHLLPWVGLSQATTEKPKTAQQHSCR